MSDRGDATELVVTGPWTQEAADAVGSGGVDRLVLNYALGFDSPSLDFLQGQPIRDLVVLDPRLSDLAPIHTLAPTLERLSVTTNPGLTLDLERLPRLRDLSSNWSQVEGTIDAAEGLRVAALRGYSAPDLVPIRPLVMLTSLTLKDRPSLKSLNGVASLPDLRSLGVYLAKNLDNIGQAADCRALEDLALESCRKITRIDALSGCTRLRSLNLSECGDVESLSPLVGLIELEHLRLFGNTRIVDDDLSPLLALPRLKSLRMRSRRTYRPLVEEVLATLAQG